LIRLQPGFDCAFEFVVRSGCGLGLDIKTVCGLSWSVSLDFPAVMDDGLTGALSSTLVGLGSL